MKLTNLAVVFLVGILAFHNGENLLMPPRAVAGNNLENVQKNQIVYTRPESACDRIPDGLPPTYDDLPDLLFVAAVAFLVGFKIAARMGRNQAAKLRTIWGK